MEVPFRLKRREVAVPAADAFLLFASDAGPLAGACARFGELPAVFAVRDGFLLVPRGADARPLPGAIRLRRLAGDLFVPADADLLPTLLPDEAGALTRDRGLIVLPGGTVFAFDATTPLPISRWLAPAAVRRAEWRAFPPRPDSPNALTVIERPSPPVRAIVDVLGDGAPDDTRPLPGPGDGVGAVPDDARPPSGSRLGRAAAGAGLAAGGFLAWLGKRLGAAGLARRGADLARRALERVPRLGEKLLGEQEAALREVLRQLQSGDVEKGLKRAPVAVSDPDRPARVGTDARLAPRDPRYSLRDLIASGGGGAAAWLGGGDVWAELAREYRRLAAEAGARGDHRRAAYLYGVLLRDLRAAANALLAGGLFRDAALLLRDRLNDPRAAADAFDRAGDHDEALRLYDRLGEYGPAAELLRRLGDEERAVGYYVRAADRLAATCRFLAAGDLLRAKAHRPDLATKAYRAGWLHSGSAESVTCAERLIDEHLVAADRAAFEALMNEAERTLADRPRDAGRLFNYALRVGEDFLPADSRADLADRVRLQFAGHLRTYAAIGEAGALVGGLFPNDQIWPPPVGRDATFATRGRAEAPVGPEPPREADRRLVAGPVTAVVVVRGTFDVVVAGADGISLWRVARGQVQRVGAVGNDRVTALSASAQGDVVYAVTSGADGKWRLRCFAADRSGAFEATAQYTLPTDENTEPNIYIQPSAVFRAGEHRVAVATPVERLDFVGLHLAVGPVDPFLGSGQPVHLLAKAGDGRTWCWADESIFSRGPSPDSGAVGWNAPWAPATPVDWLTPAPSVLEVTAVDAGECVRWTGLDTNDPEQICTRLASSNHGYTAACLVAPGVVAAVTPGNEVHWFRVVGRELTVAARVTVGVPARVVALTARPDANEVIAVFADGGAVRLRRP